MRKYGLVSSAAWVIRVSQDLVESHLVHERPNGISTGDARVSARSAQSVADSIFWADGLGDSSNLSQVLLHLSNELGAISV
jgi:hypothetical protein